MRTRCLLALLLLLVGTRTAAAYEGAGIGREEAPEKPPPAPKLTRSPTVAQLVDAGWPAGAAMTEMPVDVVLVIDLDAAGHVAKAEVTRSGGAAFDEAARAALLGSLFTPAELDGKPAPVRLEFAYHFVPAPKPVPKPEEPPKPKPVNLKGVVVERGTRDPLPNATVAISETALQIDTDAQGRFQFAGVPVGTVTLIIVAAGHDKSTTKVDIKPAGLAEVKAYLWPSVAGGYEATVKGDRDRTEVSQRTLEGEELTHVPGTHGDPLRALGALPGMARPSFISGALLVRGAQPQDTTVMFDGVPIPLLYHFGSGPSVINPSFIDRIDFLPGAYGVEYGRAIAGAVDVKTNPRAAVRVHGKADVNMLDSSFYLEGPAWDPKYGSWAIAGRRSYVDLFLPAVLKFATRPGQTSIVAAPVYWDFQARYDLSLGKHHLALVGFGSNDSLKVEQAGQTNTRPFSLNTQQGFYRVGLKWTWQPAEGWRFAVSPTVGTTINALSAGDTINISTNALDLNLRANAIRDFTKWLSLQLGIDGFRSAFTNTFTTTPSPQPGQPTPAPTVNTSNPLEQAIGTYLEGIWKPVESVRVAPGLRVEAYGLPRGETTSFEPRVNVRWQLIKPLALKAGWGLFSQAPQPSDLDSRSGNPNLGLEHSNQVAAGFEWRILPELLLDIQGYYNLRSDLVVNTTDTMQSNGLTVPERKNNSGKGRTYGLEVLLKHEFTKRLFGWIAYTLSRSEQWDPNTSTYVPISTDQTHILSVVGSYHITPAWEVGLRLQYTSGEPQTPVIGATYDVDTGSYAPLNGAPGSVRGPYFFQLDLRAEHYWVYQDWKLSVYLDIQNLTNAANPQLTLYDYRYQQSASINGLPFLPYIGLTAAF